MRSGEDLDKPFDKPVPIRLKDGHFRSIGSVQEAAQALLYKWPDDGAGKRHLAARRACLKVLEGWPRRRRRAKPSRRPPGKAAT